jgi:eukaryotic-like serine/threonine-protein kinase
MDALEQEPLKLFMKQHIGNYRLIRLLGNGAFANIYLAQHCYLRTQVAVKISRKQLTQGQGERFLKEAQIAARLVHPLIVRVLEFAIEQGIPYLVMDYAAQGSLRQRHPIGERLEREYILGYAWDISEALEYIHGQHYIHRDLKPENLLIGRDGQILVSDFGIAIAVQETWGEREQERIGTLPYMAPEQIAGRPCIASDQYALGVIIYEWICGKLPFDGEDRHIAWQHLNAQPPGLCKQVPGLPRAVERVVLRALEKDSRKRFASVVEFVGHLEEAWATVPPPVQRISFYGHPTYQTDTTLEIPAIEPFAKKAAPERSKAQGKKRTKTTWKNVANTFALDFLLSIVAQLLMPDPSRFLWLASVIVIGGLPICTGLALHDRRILTMGLLTLGMEFASVLLFQGPLAFIWAAVAGTSLCWLIAFASYLHFSK